MRRLAPFVDVAELRELFIVAEQAAAAGERQIEPPQAEIIPPPLHEHGRELARDHRVEERQILADELLLQADRVRRDDDLRPRRRRVAIAARRPALRLQLGRRQNRRHQVGKTLADAGPRLDHQMLLLADRPRDGLRHLELLRPMLVILPAAPQCDQSAPGYRRQKASCRQA